MHEAANIVVGLVAFIHLYILVLEKFLWTKPTGLKVFGLSKEFSAKTRTLAANQGLYNGFLAAGLIWGLLSDQVDVQVFFLGCVLVAGIYGTLTANEKIIWVQAVPAVIGLVLVGLA
ncbi:MAG: DUF1304 domain-containing protein [Gammaproteobacteria bacterium]|nr:DUF1304 domain-containing protein [Sideroxydans sp.]MBU3903474.1 DUF1304 domain-containing protein [Gammaproteobacteria bacterium]MBU4045515.1 DUF1304 domain-containing protein [Gammaproteobacteria bacterium]